MPPAPIASSIRYGPKRSPIAGSADAGGARSRGAVVPSPSPTPTEVCSVTTVVRMGIRLLPVLRDCGSALEAEQRCASHSQLARPGAGSAPPGQAWLHSGQDGTTAVGDSWLYPHGIYRQMDPDFRFDRFVARHCPSGALLGSFGTGGRIYRTSNDLNAVSFVRGCTLQNDRLVAALHTGGASFSYELALMRFLEDGSTDPGFGASGGMTYPIDIGGNGIGHEASVHVLPQGDICPSTAAPRRSSGAGRDGARALTAPMYRHGFEDRRAAAGMAWQSSSEAPVICAPRWHRWRGSDSDSAATEATSATTGPRRS